LTRADFLGSKGRRRISLAVGLLASAANAQVCARQAQDRQRGMLAVDFATST
jgi:hypothetical protein